MSFQFSVSLLYLTCIKMYILWKLTGANPYNTLGCLRSTLFLQPNQSAALGYILKAAREPCLLKSLEHYLENLRLCVYGSH